MNQSDNIKDLRLVKILFSDHIYDHKTKTHCICDIVVNVVKRGHSVSDHPYEL